MGNGINYLDAFFLLSNSAVKYTRVAKVSQNTYHLSILRDGVRDRYSIFENEWKLLLPLPSKNMLPFSPKMVCWLSKPPFLYLWWNCERQYFQLLKAMWLKGLMSSFANEWTFIYWEMIPVSPSRSADKRNVFSLFFLPLLWKQRGRGKEEIAKLALFSTKEKATHSDEACP